MGYSSITELNKRTQDNKRTSMIKIEHFFVNDLFGNSTHNSGTKKVFTEKCLITYDHFFVVSMSIHSEGITIYFSIINSGSLHSSQISQWLQSNPPWLLIFENSTYFCHSSVYSLLFWLSSTGLREVKNNHI